MAALSTTLLVAGSVLSAGSSIAQGIGARKAANFATKQAEQQANDVLARSEEDVTRYRQDLGQLLGTQRTRLAASNVDLTQGSAAQVRDQTVGLFQSPRLTASAAPKPRNSCSMPS